MIDNGIATFYPKTKRQWRNWLQKNHTRQDAVWLVMYKKNAGQPTVNWSDAVDEALCFGWIDSTKKSLDDQRSIQLFTKRKPKSTWSKINKTKIKRLIDSGKMVQAGLDCVETAKTNGSWSILDDVEELLIPADLEAALGAHGGAKDYFLTLSRSIRKSMLQWIKLAKLPETRQKRIDAIAILTSKRIKPKAAPPW